MEQTEYQRFYDKASQMHVPPTQQATKLQPALFRRWYSPQRSTTVTVDVLGHEKQMPILASLPPPDSLRSVRRTPKDAASEEPPHLGNDVVLAILPG